MVRWIVTNIPSTLFLVILVACICAATIAGLTFVRRRFPGLAEGKHNDVTNVGMSVVGPVYGFFIGFIVAFLLSQLATEDEWARTEGTAAISMTRELNVFARADGDRIRQSLMEYEQAALAEWPQAANGRPTPEAETALAGLYSAVQNVKPGDDRQRVVLMSALRALKELSDARTERLLSADAGFSPPLALWAVIFLSSGLVLAFAVAFGAKQQRWHYAVVTAVSVLVAANLFLVIELAYPYLGVFAPTPEPLHAVIKMVQGQLPQPS